MALGDIVRNFLKSNLNDQLIQEGHATSYDGGKR